jgi:enterochelin esterase family protein
LPLLVVHDGPEYARYSRLVDYLEWLHASGRLPPCRAALLSPVARDETYSASAAYARALSGELLPALERLAPQPAASHARVGMGASLGALALLHAVRREPAAFPALFLQSGSFFRASDVYERGFPRFARITRFVASVLASGPDGRRLRVAMTCGAVEENLGCNRALQSALVRQGHDATLALLADGHNWTAWRDGFEPQLGRLLEACWP